MLCIHVFTVLFIFILQNVFLVIYMVLSFIARLCVFFLFLLLVCVVTIELFLINHV